MPQLIAGALTAAAPGVFGTAIIGTVTLGQIAGYMVFSSLTNAAMKNLRGSTAIQTRTLNVREALGAEAVIYGQCRVGGNVTFMETDSSGQYVIQVITVAAHEIEGFVSGGVYLNEENVTLDGSGYVTTDGWDGQAIQMKFFDGSQTAVSSDLNTWSDSGNITSNFIGHERAYVAIRYDFSKDALKRGIPNCSFIVQGKKVYDPRTATTAYSANAALVIRDWLASKYGIDAVSAELPDSFWNAEANVCDENVSLSGGGTEKRYEINGTFRTTDGRDIILQRMLASCGGSLIHSQGYYLLKTGYYTAPTITLTEDDLRGDINLETRTSAQQNFNTVRGTFADAGNDYLPVEFDEISPAGFVSEDDGNVVPTNIELPFTTSAAAAQRLAKMMLYRSREQYTLAASFGLKAMQLAVGDTVSIDINGIVTETFEVERWEPEKADDGGLVVNLVLRETSSAAYSWSAEESAIVRANAVIDLDALADRYNIRTVTSNCLANYLKDHTVFNGSTWTTFRSSVSANTTNPPSNGVDLADTLVEDSTASNTHGIYQDNSALTGGDVCYASVYAKRGSGTRNIQVKARESGTSASMPYATYDLSDGSNINSGNGVTDHGAVDVGGGWYRVWIKWTSTASISSTGVVVYLYNGGVTYSGDGSSSIVLWGASLDVASSLPNFPGYEYPKVIKDSIVANGSSTNYHADVTWHFQKSQKSSPAKPPRADDICIIKGYLNNTPTYYSAAFVFDGQYWEPIDRWVGGEMLLDETVDTAQMVDSAVTTAKVNDGAITTGKVATDAITTVKVVDNAITDLSAVIAATGSSSTTSTSPVDAATLSFSATAGADVLLIFDWWGFCQFGGSWSTGDYADFDTVINGAASYGKRVIAHTANNTYLNYRHMGFTHIFTASASNTVKIQYSVSATVNTAYIFNASIIAIELKK